MLTTTLWAAQIILALYFLFGGLPKVLGRGIDRWIGFDDIPRPVTILIGVAELAASVALVLPLLLGAFEWTTPLAAVGLVVVTLMASGFHVRAGEWLPGLATTLWAMLAGVVAIGRWDLLTTGPSLGADLLVPVIAVLVVAIVVTLVVVFRMPAPSRAEAREAAVRAAEGTHV
ncbi:DoxX family protein [Promicromonospora soli]